MRVPVFVRLGALASLPAILGSTARVGRVAVVTDDNVARLYGSRLRCLLRSAGWRADWYPLKSGERVKSMRVIAQLHDMWFERGYDRSTPVIALGGGTIGDAVGYAAATFMRGLPLIQVPTTIIGQVDSAIGGKVGINHRRGKNLIGCYYHPAAVVVDPAWLSTLPPREIRSGLAEVVKYGIIADPKLFRRCEAKLSDWISLHDDFDPMTIKRCIAIKLRVVAADERDLGLRHVLNFGHTLGHAFEAWGRFQRFKHGEAVTMGMMAASAVARRRGILSQRDFDRVSNLCAVIAPSARGARFVPSDIMPFLSVDKKRASGQNAWVLPVRIGRVTIVRDLTDNEIKDAVRFVRLWLERVG